MGFIESPPMSDRRITQVKASSPLKAAMAKQQQGGRTQTVVIRLQAGAGNAAVARYLIPTWRALRDDSLPGPNDLLESTGMGTDASTILVQRAVPRGLPRGTAVLDLNNGNHVVYIIGGSGLDPDRYYVGSAPNTEWIDMLGHRDRHALNLTDTLFYRGRPIGGGTETIYDIEGPVPPPFISGSGIERPHLSVMSPQAHANHVYHVKLWKRLPPDPLDPPWMPAHSVTITYHFGANGAFLRTNPAQIPQGMTGTDVAGGRVFAQTQVHRFRSTAATGFIA